MPDLFGLDIAGLVADSIASAGGVLDVTLTKVSRGTRTPGNLAAGTNPTTADHPCKGFFDDRQLLKLRGVKDEGGSSLVRRGDRALVILGATLPAGVQPEPSDVATVQDDQTETVTVDRIIERDPAAATYVCHCRST